MTEQRSAKDILALLSGIDDEIQSMQEAKQQITDIMAPFQDKQRELRAELLALMETEGIDRVRGSGQVAVINHRTDYQIVNAHAARLMLESWDGGDAYFRLNEPAVKALARNRAIDGVVKVTSNELRITKKEQ